MTSQSQVPEPVPASPSRDFHFRYTVQKGFFAQSEDETNDKEFDFVKDSVLKLFHHSTDRFTQKKNNFGLIERSYPTDKDGSEEEIWRRFKAYVESLTADVNKGESYKVLFLGRHGQGWHNVAETKYGTKAWDCYWSALDGADGLTWFDAHLTPTGQQQALDVNALWKAQIPRGIPLPETYYVSPMTRTIETADLTFNGLDLPEGQKYRPFIKELVREALGVHTCDKRHPKSHIEKAFKHVTFEDGFSEDDELWEKDYREPASARKYRLATLLDDIFATDSNVWLSLTSHSGAIASILEAAGHRKFALETGGVIPVFLKAEKVEGKRVKPPKEPSEGPPMCEEPPTDL